MQGKNHVPDIKADAAALRLAAALTVDDILQRRAGMDLAGQAAVPLFVVAGESHRAGTHQAYRIAVIEGLRAAGERPVVCLEESHDSLQRQFAKSMRGAVEPSDGEALNALDVGGALSLQSSLGFTRYLGADHAAKTFRAYLHDTGVQTCYADASINKKGILDRQDEKTDSSLRACFSKMASNLLSFYCDSMNGLYVRNHHMAARAVQFAQETEARIVYHQCGNAHVAGDKVAQDPWEQSLSAQLLALGAAVQALPLKARGFRPQTPGRTAGLVRHLVTGVPDGVLSVMEDRASHIHEPIAVAPAQYVNSVLTEMQLHGAVMTVDVRKKREAACRAEVLGVFREIKISEKQGLPHLRAG